MDIRKYSYMGHLSVKQMKASMIGKKLIHTSTGILWDCHKVKAVGGTGRGVRYYKIVSVDGPSIAFFKPQIELLIEGGQVNGWTLKA